MNIIQTIIAATTGSFIIIFLVLLLISLIEKLSNISKK
jgi:lipopolysaccharide export LptBFGC system permease protein LptF